MTKKFIVTLHIGEGTEIETLIGLYHSLAQRMETEDEKVRCNRNVEAMVSVLDEKTAKEIRKQLSDLNVNMEQAEKIAEGLAGQLGKIIEDQQQNEKI